MLEILDAGVPRLKKPILVLSPFPRHTQMRDVLMFDRAEVTAVTGIRSKYPSQNCRQSERQVFPKRILIGLLLAAKGPVLPGCEHIPNARQNPVQVNNGGVFEYDDIHPPRMRGATPRESTFVGNLMPPLVTGRHPRRPAERLSTNLTVLRLQRDHPHRLGPRARQHDIAADLLEILERILIPAH